MKLAAAVLALLLLPVAAPAMTITGGTIGGLPYGRTPLMDLSLSGVGLSIVGEAYWDESLCSSAANDVDTRCVPGERVSLNRSWELKTTNVWWGHIELAGVPGPTPSVFGQFTAFEITAPPLAAVGSTVTATGPFRFDGLIFDDSTGIGQTMVLVGQGIVTLELIQTFWPVVGPLDTVGPPEMRWHTNRLIYEFAPTPAPEPGTLVLLGGTLGAVGLALRRRIRPRVMILLALALTGCASPGLAMYQHPQTKDWQTCVRAKPVSHMTGVDLLDALIIIPLDAADEVIAGSQYADCKTRLERQGYVREP